MLVQKSSFHFLEQEAGKKFGKPNNRPQEQYPEFYRHARKLNYGLLDGQIQQLTDQEKVKMTSFAPTTQMLNVNYRALKLYPSWSCVKVIESNEDFLEMIEHLGQQFELGVDLEFHQKYSFRGTTTLLQISSVEKDYIICPFKYREQICGMLRAVFADPRITKVFHAIDNDSLALRRDFGIIVVGGIDTKEAYKLLANSNQAISLENLLKKMELSYKPKNMPEKKYAQLADWRLRPLPHQLIAYARHDSHSVLRAWNKLKLKFTEAGTDVKAAFAMTTELLIKLKYKPPKQQDPLSGLKTVNLSQSPDLHQKQLQFIDLHRWRHDLGMMSDCSPEMILSNQHIVEIIDAKPNNPTEMQLLLDARFPSFLRGKQNKMFFQVLSTGLRSDEISSKCHNCFLRSHQAWACWKAKDRQAWKAYMNDPKNRAIKNAQYQRRMRKLHLNQLQRKKDKHACH